MTEFCVWAPEASSVRVEVEGSLRPLDHDGDGWWSTTLATAPDATYSYQLDESDSRLPDPRSRFQPDGVHGPSQLVPTDFAWTDGGWTGRGLPGAVLYELHIGTFTSDGTFDAAVERLGHLVELGITHVEVLPVNAVNGQWNWGYDGVDWYAVHAPYGGPTGLKRFVDACHVKGLAVVLDVVYNHLGPSGNYLPAFGPYLKSGRNTWGDLVNVELEPVRRFILDNVQQWLGEFHVDALRLDAVHALVDDSPTHILEQMAIEVDALSAHVGRPLTLIAESDLNDPVLVTAREGGGYGLQAQWDDDIHHTLHALITGERQGYYDDFGTLAGLAKVYTSVFFHDGTYSTFRQREHGAPVDRERIPAYRFVSSLQNHDQIGNRAVGDRLPEITSEAMLRVGALLLLTAPYTPMLFMGEEWAARTRWPFFTSHPEPELGRLTGEGRLAEFDGHGWDVSQMMDPQDPAAYESAKLDWSEIEQGSHRRMLEFYRTLLRLRRTESELTDPRLDRIRFDYDEEAGWAVIHRDSLRILLNLANAPQSFALPASTLLVATDTADLADAEVTIGPHSAAIVRVIGHPV